jgi:hypothetical protein
MAFHVCLLVPYADVAAAMTSKLRAMPMSNSGKV